MKLHVVHGSVYESPSLSAFKLPSPRPLLTLPRDSSTKLAHFKLNCLDELVLRRYVALQERTVRSLVDDSLVLFLRHRTWLHQQGRCALYESAPKGHRAVGVFAQRSHLLRVERWAEFDDQDHRTVYYNALLLMLRWLRAQGELEEALRIVLSEESADLTQAELIGSEMLWPKASFDLSAELLSVRLDYEAEWVDGAPVALSSAEHGGRGEG